MSMAKKTFRKEIEIFNQNSGLMKTSEALAKGINAWDLYAMVDLGILEKVSRGVYHLATQPAIDNPDLTVIAMRAPRAVIFLVSALYFHDLTTQLPRKIYIALPQKWKPPKIKKIPLDITYLSPKSYQTGISIHKINNIDVKIYDVEKTIVDCFRFRNKIGTPIAVEALQDAWRQNRLEMEKLYQYAKIGRVAKIMTPYLESLG